MKFVDYPLYYSNDTRNVTKNETSSNQKFLLFVRFQVSIIFTGQLREGPSLKIEKIET